MADFSFSVEYLLQNKYPQVFKGDQLPTIYKQYESSTGTPLIWGDHFGREYFLPIWINNYEMPFPCLSVRVRKHIVDTEMTERHGTVKEIINTGDYEFMIRGFCIGKNEWPEQKIKELLALYTKKEALTMQSALSDIFLFDQERKGYDKVVITDLEFPEYRGVEWVKPYQMTLRSDSPFNLIEKK